MTRQDWLLLVLAAAGRKPLSPLQLQKSLFLVGYDLAKLVGPDFYTFRPFDYSPFDATVYRDAEEQAAQGLVTIRSHPVTRRRCAPTGMLSAATCARLYPHSRRRSQRRTRGMWAAKWSLMPSPHHPNSAY